MKILFSLILVARRQWRWMLAGILLGIAVVAANALLMALSGWFIASMAVAGATGAAFNYVFPAAAIRALAILRTTGRYGERLVTHEAAFRMLTDLRVWLFRCLEPLAPAGLEHYGGGDVAGRLRADVDSMENLYLRILAPLITGALSCLLSVLFVACWDRTSALALGCVLFCSGGLLPLLARKLAQAPGQRSTEIAGELRSHVTEGIQGMEELLLLGARQRQAAEVNDLSQQLITEQQRLGSINGLLLGSSIACGGIGLAVILVAAGSAVQSATISGPALVMLLLFSTATFEAVGLLPSALQALPASKAAAQRIHQLSGTPAPVPEPALPALLNSADHTIIFQSVSSSYSSNAPALDRFNLEIPHATTLTLTGPSGCGKSTVAGILLRFRTYQGSVTVGGDELSSLDSDTLRRVISGMPQQPHLFNTTIRENILLGRPEASDSELQSAVDDAGLSSWVATLPQGMDTPVGESATAVSGGEARRIALARALLKNAPIMILDEPTEGLDAVTEQAVVAALSRRLTGKTALVISHRPACLALAHQVVRMGTRN